MARPVDRWKAPVCIGWRRSKRWRRAGFPQPWSLNARQVKQIKGCKTDVADSVWLARVYQFAMATPSHVLPNAFRELRVLTRYPRTLVGQRSRVRNRVQKVLDRSGVRAGGVLSDVFGTNGRRILDGLVQWTGSRPRVDALPHATSVRCYA